MKTIVMVSQKGGVSKTSSCEALVYGLKNKGYRVLACDLDQSANLTNELIGDDYKLDAGDLISGKWEPKDVIKDDVIPGGNGLVGLPSFFETHDYDTLRKALKPAEDDYDFLIIDTPPSASKVILAALSSSDYVIIPAEPTMACIQGCMSTLEMINLVKSRYNDKLTNLGILLVKFKERYNAHSEILKLLKEQKFELFNTTIRESQAINNAKLMRQSFFAKEYRTAKAVIDYHSFVREVLKKIEGM